MGAGVIPIAAMQQVQRTRALRRTVCARLGIHVAASMVGFLLAYAVLQTLHAFGRDPSAVKALSAIPLFARVMASGCISGLFGAVSGFITRDPERSLHRIPRTLGIAITLFIAVIVVFP